MHGDNDDDDDNYSSESYDSLNVIEELVEYLYAKFQNVSLMDNNKHSAEELLDNFPKDEIFPNQDYYKPLFEEFKRALTEELPKEELNSENLYDTKCNLILALFLVNLSKQLSLHILKEISVFACFLRRALNEYGWDIKRNESQNLRHLEYCETQNGRDILELTNQFITDLVGDYIRDLKPNELQLIKEEHINTHMIKLTQYFCNWIYFRKYTNSQLQLNNDD